MKLHPIFQVHVLGKLVKTLTKERTKISKFIEHEGFKHLYETMKLKVDQMDPKALSSFILYSAYLGIRDEQVLEYVKEKITIGNFRQINPQDLSHFLLAFAKANYMTEYLANNIVRKLSDTQPFNIFISNRNLWA